MATVPALHLSSDVGSLGPPPRGWWVWGHRGDESWSPDAPSSHVCCGRGDSDQPESIGPISQQVGFLSWPSFSVNKTHHMASGVCLTGSTWVHASGHQHYGLASAPQPQATGAGVQDRQTPLCYGHMDAPILGLYLKILQLSTESHVSFFTLHAHTYGKKQLTIVLKNGN